MFRTQLQQILDREVEEDFQSVSQNWRPKKLLFVSQCHQLLADMERRYQALDKAKDEFGTLTYRSKYMRYLLRMKIWVRDSKFVWHSDQLKFLKSVAGFYADYGAVLRLLRNDQLRGSLYEPQTESRV